MTDQLLPKLRVLHYLLSESEGETVVHCLDLDLVASAGNEAEAVRRLNTLVKAQIEYALNKGDYAVLSTPAPNKYWASYLKAPEIKIIPSSIEVRLPQIVPADEEESELGVLAAQQLAHAV